MAEWFLRSEGIFGPKHSGPWTLGQMQVFYDRWRLTAEAKVRRSDSDIWQDFADSELLLLLSKSGSTPVSQLSKGASLPQMRDGGSVVGNQIITEDDRLFFRLQYLFGSVGLSIATLYFLPDFSIVPVFIFWYLAVALAALPIAIATKRHHPQKLPITILTIAGCFTGIAWIAALVWATMDQSKRNA